MIRFWEPVLGMVLLSVFGISLGTPHGSEVGSRGSGDGTVEEYCFGEIMLVNYCCVCFCGSGDGYPLVERIDVDGGADIGYIIGL